MFTSQYDVFNRFMGSSKYLHWVRYNAKLYREKYLDGIKVIEARLFGETIIRFREPDFNHPEDIHIYLPFVISQLVPFFKVFLPEFETEMVGQEIRMRYRDEPGYFVVTDKMCLRIIDGHLAVRRDFEMR